MHNVQVLFMIDLRLLFETLLERMNRVLKVLALVVVFLLNVSINFDILHLLILDILVQLVMNVLLKHIIVIDVLNYPINCIFKALDLCVISSNMSSVVRNQLLHLFLSRSQIIDNNSKLHVSIVVLSKVFVHSGGIDPEFGDFSLLWSDLTLKLFNLEVQHELKLIKLLCSFLKCVNCSLTISYSSIFFIDFLPSFLDLSPQSINRSLLILKLGTLILSLSDQLVDIRLNIQQLVAEQLQFSLRLQPHVLNLLQISLVFGLNLLDFLVGILVNLPHGFSI